LVVTGQESDALNVLISPDRPGPDLLNLPHVPLNTEPGNALLGSLSCTPLYSLQSDAPSTPLDIRVLSVQTLSLKFKFKDAVDP